MLFQLHTQYRCTLLNSIQIRNFVLRQSSSGNEKDYTIKDILLFLKKLDIAIQHLVAQLYNNLSLTKSDIQKIIEIIYSKILFFGIIKTT